jgi:hypothetical protein
MIHMHVMNKPTKWEDYLDLADFSYNNGYHASLKMGPFEVFYHRRCNTIVSLDILENRIMHMIDILNEIEQEVTRIKKNLKKTNDRKKRYENKNTIHREMLMGWKFPATVRGTPWYIVPIILCTIWFRRPIRILAQLPLMVVRVKMWMVM